MEELYISNIKFKNLFLIDVIKSELIFDWKNIIVNISLNLGRLWS